MTPRFATTNALNMFSGDSVSSGDRGRAVVAGADLKHLFLGEFMHPVEFTANPSRLQATGPSAMPNVSCSGDPLKVFDAVVVTHGVDVIDLLSGAGWSKKRCSYEAVEEKQLGPTVTQVRTQVSLTSGRRLYETTRLCALTSNVASEFPVSGDGVASFVSGNRPPVGVAHG